MITNGGLKRNIKNKESNISKIYNQNIIKYIEDLQDKRLLQSSEKSLPIKKK